MDKIDLTRFFSLLPLLLFFFVGLDAQEVKKERIDILWSDDVYIERNRESGKDWHRLLGNVSLQHNDIFMDCDSAHFFPEKNTVDAFMNIHIRQGDTLHMYGDKLKYDGSTEIAEMSGNVILINKETHLYAPYGVYNMETKIANYTDSGRIVNKENTLKSRGGTYFTSEDLIFFKDDVEIITPDYYITSDTMQYNTETEVVFFHGPTDVTGDSLFMHGERGWYDTKNDISTIWKNASVNNMQQLFKGDSIFYNDSTGFGESFGNISIIDTTNKMMVRANYARATKEPESFMATDNAMFIQFNEGDSLYLHADTLNSVTIADSLGDYRFMSAYYNCKVFGSELQAKCDSLSYSFRDSVIRLYYNPVIWSEENQLTADSIALFTKNMNPERLELYNSAFVISQVDSLRFNQIKGRTLTGYFRDNELYRIYVDGNGQTIYYLVDNDALMGMNTAECSTIELFFEEGQITEIYQYEPGGDIDPPNTTEEPDTRIEGFNWLDALRPKSVEDIFK